MGHAIHLAGDAAVALRKHAGVWTQVNELISSRCSLRTQQTCTVEHRCVRLPLEESSVNKKPLHKEKRKPLMRGHPSSARSLFTAAATHVERDCLLKTPV